MFYLVVVSLLLVALKNCLDLQNPVTTVYAGTTSTCGHYVNGVNGTYVSSDADTKAFKKVISVGNTFNNVEANVVANNTYSSIEEEYAAFHCCGPVVA